MAERLNREFVAEKAIIHEAPALSSPATIDRTFELPTALYVGTAAERYHGPLLAALEKLDYVTT